MRRPQTPQPPRRGLTVALATLALAGAATAQAVNPEWTILKPSNTGIPGDFTQDIFIDEDDAPWITGRHPFFQEGGAGRWDETTDTWTTLTNVDYPQVPSEYWEDIDQDASGVLWIATDEGLMRYDPAVGPSSIQVWDRTNSPMPNNWVREISIAPDGTIWLAITDQQPVGGLVQFDPAANTWNVWTTANGLPWGEQWPGWDWIHYVAAAPDDDGGYTVFFGSTEMGAATYKDGVFESYANNPPPGPLVYGLPGGDVVDNLGNTWLSTAQGLVRRTPDGTMTVVPIPASGRVEAFEDGRVGLASSQGQVWLYDGSTWTDLGFWGATITTSLAQEESGEVWVGGNAGAARYKDGAWQRYRVTNTGMLGRFIDTIDFDAAGNVYMNGNAGPGVGGFAIYDGQRWTSVNDLNYGLGPAWGLPTDDVDVLATRADGSMALDIGGVPALMQWDGAAYNQLNSTPTEEVDEDGLGRLWSGHWGKLVRYDPGGSVVEFDTTNSPMFNFPVRALVADASQPGWIWATTGTGFVHTDGVTWETYPIDLFGFQTQESIQDISPAPDGTVWAATSAGVIHFDPVTGEVRQYTHENAGLPANSVMHVEVAPDGSVWASSFDSLVWPYPGGLSRFDGQTWETWNTSNSPLPHNQHGALTSRATPTGYEIWVGTSSEGVAVLSVDKGAERFCHRDLGFGGPRHPSLRVCGERLRPGKSATIELSGAPASAPLWLIWGFEQSARPVRGAIVPAPPHLHGPFVTDARGEHRLPIVNPFGALDLYVQHAVLDPTRPDLIALSNAVLIEFLP